jgi:hypothetical protein
MPLGLCCQFDLQRWCICSVLILDSSLRLLTGCFALQRGHSKLQLTDVSELFHRISIKLFPAGSYHINFFPMQCTSPVHEHICSLPRVEADNMCEWQTDLSRCIVMMHVSCCAAMSAFAERMAVWCAMIAAMSWKPSPSSRQLSR